MSDEKPNLPDSTGVSVPPVVLDPAAYTVIQHSDDRPTETRERP